MSNEPSMTISGNLAGDPELRFTPAGKAVVNFSIASTPRRYDKQADEWKDGTTLWMRCSMWGKPGENAAECLQKGDRVIAIGRIGQREWEKDGEKRVSIEMTVDEVGASLTLATVQIHKAGKNQPRKQASTAPQAADDSAAPW